MHESVWDTSNKHQSGKMHKHLFSFYLSMSIKTKNIWKTETFGQ